jgi:predicted aminopeptidase
VNISSIVPRFRAALAAIVVTLGAVATSGCYWLQSAQGHLAVMAQRKPIAGVIANPSTPPAVKRQLEQVTAIRNFASRELGLPDNGSYRSYADVGRPYVVWNVFAAQEFSLEPKKWCYPIVGCVAYRGYFSMRRADQFADELRAKGLDVAVGGVSAYSTLGHFDDPILSTMLGWSDVQLAAIIFHELTHQLLYVPNDASFNEALASTVEEEGVRRWLRSEGRDKDLAGYERQQSRYGQVIELLGAARARLAAVYGSQASPQTMREQKRAVFASLRSSYAELEAQWGGHGPFDGWFSEDLNNAHLASIATYRSCVPGFQRELAAAGGDLRAFFGRVRELAKQPQGRRDAMLCENA